MTISEFKLENHKPITAETADSVVLYDGSFANEGDKLIDAYLVQEDESLLFIHFTPNSLIIYELSLRLHLDMPYFFLA